ncbi:DUF6544 family protein [Pontimicrobium sp. SW4]|uniref:DUF6544 family protein n=1 Tax=Pontimicrobium sp. SW4 TaxID=3153519 RepID=A0AAU7BWA1_9FLAO
MKIIFALIVIIHALIHLLGFVKAFQLAEITQLTQNISKPIGMLWLFATIAFLISITLVLLKKDWWFFVALIAVIISQTLIIIYWKDAKFGTIANAIILLVSISAYGNYRFNKMVQTESKQILQNIKVENLPIVSKSAINHLPEIVQKWMLNSGVIGKEQMVSVHLKQVGEMRIKPDGNWMPFTATQDFNVKNPAFVWATKVKVMPIISMVGRDKLYNGEGEMLIKLASLIPVVNEGENDKINQGAMIRFLAEICWFPSAVINDNITWESINDTSAKATLTINDKSVLGLFTFSDEGNLMSFEAQRYYGGKNDSKLEKWYVEMLSYKTFNGITIPNKSSVTWKLNEGDFNWLQLEITNLKFNHSLF